MAFIGKVPTPVPLTSADITDGIISSAKIANGTITATDMDLSGTYAFTGTVTGASTPMTPAFFAYLNSDQNTSNSANVKVACNVEVFDTDSKYDNSTNYRFTPTIAGKYMVFMNLYIATSVTSSFQHGTVKLYKNGTELSFSRTSHRSNQGEAAAISWSGVVDLDTDDYIEMYGQGEGGGNASFFKGGSSNQASSFGAYKIIE